jgi:hypothetical protein
VSFGGSVLRWLVVWGSIGIALLVASSWLVVSGSVGIASSVASSCLSLVDSVGIASSLRSGRFPSSSPAILKDCGTQTRMVRRARKMKDDATMPTELGGHDGQATKGGGNKDDNPCPPMVIGGIGSVAACESDLR